MRQKNVIAIDVDNTLRLPYGLNHRLVSWCENKRMEGYSLMLWSARGQAYAIDYAEQHGVDHLFDVICSKPDYIVDDQGWGWIKHTEWIKDEQKKGQELEGNLAK